VATVNWITSAVGWALSAWRKVTGIASDIPDALHDLWHFAAQAVAGIRYVFTHPLASFLNAWAILSALLTGNTVALRNAMFRLVGWYDVNRLNPLRAAVILWFRQLRARIAYLFALAYLFINLRYRQALAYTRRLVTAEHQAMLRAFAAAEAYTRKLTDALHKTIESEAASAYAATLKNRASIVNRLADLIATRNPVVRGAVRDLIRVVLDLLAIDDPLARLAATFLIREIVNRLGVDKAAGTLLADIAGPLLGDPKPKGIPDVIKNIGQRLDGHDSQWTTFMDDGGPELLQAGKEWKGLTSYLTDAAMLAFFADAVARPQRWAAETAAVAGPAVHEATAAVSALLGR
jgi:hypothetical protein